MSQEEKCYLCGNKSVGQMIAKNTFKKQNEKFEIIKYKINVCGNCFDDCVKETKNNKEMWENIKGV